MSNGDVLALTADSARIAGHFNAQDIYVMEIVSVKSVLLFLKIGVIYLKTVSFWQPQLSTSNRR